MPLARILLDRSLVSPDQIAEARKHREVAGGTLADNLVVLGFISRESLDSVLYEPPPVPETIEETGISPAVLFDLILKSIYTTGLETSPSLADYVKLPDGIIELQLEEAKRKRLLEVLGVSDADGAYRYGLTELGRKRALDALQLSQYTGPAPVALAAYEDQVGRQSIGVEPITAEALARSLSQLVFPETILERLGPAVNSAKSVLLYGASGNGKTSIAEALGGAFHNTIFVPYCIAVDHQIVKVYDPSLHEEGVPRTNGGGGDGQRRSEADARWVACRRPVVITGGELTMAMLDLSFDSAANYYEAPVHMKANGGVFIIDDFGRQRVPPRDLLNRWILPLERRVDYLTLRTGKKLRLPFDQLVVFSTNIPPQELMDEATLRRVQYKIEIPAPTAADYETILRRVCDEERIEFSRDVLTYLLEVFYPKTGASPSAYHPRFIVEHVMAACSYQGLAPQLSVSLAAEALRNLVVTEVPTAD